MANRTKHSCWYEVNVFIEDPFKSFHVSKYKHGWHLYWLILFRFSLLKLLDKKTLTGSICRSLNSVWSVLKTLLPWAILVCNQLILKKKSLSNVIGSIYERFFTIFLYFVTVGLQTLLPRHTTILFLMANLNSSLKHQMKV